ncbi:hypothetical protein GM658_12120 [Pseudoduganella eburnea]|uniref:Uncharacterized protein n=1 Tax=Massilia eburnea TaxID=1776165 RepID=A0A6L6QGT9_9BURK|nr:hypothetical protein [Massilia eburnea]MTW11341.1 hypothetical protein [Massilia eburnea]
MPLPRPIQLNVKQDSYLAAGLDRRRSVFNWIASLSSHAMSIAKPLKSYRWTAGIPRITSSKNMKNESRSSSIARVITSWPFLFFLSTLLLNDWLLKYAFPGTVTGKLSDFAGIAVVGTLAMSIWPKRLLTVSFVIAAGFIWWKAPLSQIAIDALNRLMPGRIGRTVDYTDLVALCVLAVCPHLSSCAERYSLFSQSTQTTLRLPLFCAAIFAITGTSYIPTRDAYSMRKTSSSVAFHRDQVADAIAQVMKQEGLECMDCSRPLETAKYSGRGLLARYTFSEQNAVLFQVEAWPDGLNFGASGKDKADALREKLKSLMAKRFNGLEYVEPLNPER